MFYLEGQGSTLNPSTLLPPTVVCPRQNDCDEIVDVLLEPYLKSNVAVLPILGEPYIGKTTMAQLVINVERVSMHFELKLWVHVSHNFSIGRITSSIIESIEGFPFRCDNLNTLQMRLEQLLRGRRYLLVLDDYWSESWEDWDKLKRSFVSGARGSKIIVTTRSGMVARVLGTLAPYRLTHLQDEDCWLLFCKCAQGTESYPHNYGDIQDRRLKEEVLQKCKGVPFIAASLGYSLNLHQENDRSKWADILRKEKWDSSTAHFNKALRLSYAQLDYHLKPCFAYSSIFPQKFQFEKEWLIQHWMAQGFIVPNSDTLETMEDMGRSYFSSLVSQSFFQRAHANPTEQQHNYSLSEMMHSLASHVSGADCKCYMMGEPYNIRENVQHLAVVFNKLSGQGLFEMSKKLHGHDWLPSSSSMSWNFHGVMTTAKDELTLEHLKAPTIIESASKKFIQKLDLSSSTKKNEQAEKILENLKAPTTIKELTVSGFTGESCPTWFGSANYMSLVTMNLYDFRRCCVLPALGLLPHLKNLHIKGWDRLISMNCREFCGTSFEGGLHKASFQSLQKLHLERMDRLQLWDGNERCAAFPSLLELILENCCKLEQVTHILPLLTKITVEGSPALLGLPNFPSLKYVNVNASGEWIWGSWPSLSSPISITLCKLPTVQFPPGLGGIHRCLQRLVISQCEQLMSIPDDWPPCNLIHFSVKHCPQLHKLPRGIQDLRVLEGMEIIDCGKLSYLPEMNGLVSLIRLEIADCGSIRSLPYTGFPSSMQVLSINRCRQLALSCSVGTDRGKIKKIFSVWINGCEVSTPAQH
ncbi:hypothetical protein PR202_gb07142 [Eleusine coracana subsp. coracana]|uniref:NB-ARC domain-containing protein n=1 Tax=Eleusine coracana subsp. coracana TaxID=191504 RepID=A0AAV5EAM9_ELECO|nr:hypothetical protein PR202_gb07142 [Eleusine coracana subsp. coracana]